MKPLPAFPAMHYDLADNEHGLTMRDYFAAQALPRIIDYWMKPVPDTFQLPEVALAIAGEAYDMADAMMKARGE
jgi:hypothetical protein